MKSKKTKILATVAGILGIAAIGVGVVSAQTTPTKPNFMSNLVTAISQKFNLNQSDVQKVFDDQKALQQTQMQVRVKQSITDRLNKAVTDGKLTQDQVNLILAEQASIQSQITSLQGKTGTDLRTAMTTIMNSEKQWATDNNIPLQYVMFGLRGPGMGHGGFGGMGMMGRFMGGQAKTTTTTQ